MVQYLDIASQNQFLKFLFSAKKKLQYIYKYGAYTPIILFRTLYLYE